MGADTSPCAPSGSTTTSSTCSQNPSGITPASFLPLSLRFHASLILGLTDADALRACFASDAVARLSARFPEFVSAVHAYEVSEALTYVKSGEALPHYER